jgi:hypothetical protein
MEASQKLFVEINNSPYLQGMSTESFLTAWIMANDAEDIYDCLLTMLPDHNNEVFVKDVREKLKSLFDRLKTFDVNPGT